MIGRELTQNNNIICIFQKKFIISAQQVQPEIIEFSGKYANDVTVFNEFLTNYSQLDDTSHSLNGSQAIITLEIFTNIEFCAILHKFISAQQVRSTFVKIT